MSEATTNEPQLQADTVELINTELSDRLARQSAAGAQIDTKAVVLVGYIAVASSFLASRPVLTWLALAAYAVAAAFGIGAYAVGTYQDVPEPRPLLNEYATGPKIAALAALAATRVEAFEINMPKQERKAARWRISLIALLVGAVLMFSSLYVHTGIHGQTRQSGHGRTTRLAQQATGSAGRGGGRRGRVPSLAHPEPTRCPCDAAASQVSGLLATAARYNYVLRRSTSSGPIALA